MEIFSLSLRELRRGNRALTCFRSGYRIIRRACWVVFAKVLMMVSMGRKPRKGRIFCGSISYCKIRCQVLILLACIIASFCSPVFVRSISGILSSSCVKDVAVRNRIRCRSILEDINGSPASV